MKKNLFFCITYYHLLIAIIKSIQMEEPNDLLIATDMKNVDAITEKLKQYEIFKTIILIDIKSIDCDKRLTDFHILQTKNKVKKFMKNVIEVKAYKGIYLFNDWNVVGEYLQACKIKYHLLEDGEDCYTHIDYFVNDINCEKISGKIRNLFHIGCNPFGKSDCVIDIEVNSVKNVKIKNKKLIENNKKKVFMSLEKKTTNMLLDIFDLKSLKKIPSNSILIVTQPLFQDGILNSEAEQMALYKQIIETYTSGETIVIKPHPRENLSYQKYFKDAIVLSGSFPIELANYIGTVSFKKGITISSTAINNLQMIEEKQILGFEYLEEWKHEI